MKKNKKLGFTLAETLITLVIIGVVAALTIPTLMNKYKTHVTETKLRKAYSLLSTAIGAAVAEHGNISEWEGFDTENQSAIVEKYIVPQLKVKEFWAQDKSTRGTHLCSTKKHPSNARQYHWFNHSGMGTPLDSPSSFELHDGTCFGFNSIHPENAIWLWRNLVFIDINGSENGPNDMGKDLFGFVLVGNTIKPYGYNWKDSDLTNPDKSHSCNPKAAYPGWVCSAYIMKNGWKIKYKI